MWIYTVVNSTSLRLCSWWVPLLWCWWYFGLVWIPFVKLKMVLVISKKGSDSFQRTISIVREVIQSIWATLNRAKPDKIYRVQHCSFAEYYEIPGFAADQMQIPSSMFALPPSYGNLPFSLPALDAECWKNSSKYFKVYVRQTEVYISFCTDGKLLEVYLNIYLNIAESCAGLFRSWSFINENFIGDVLLCFRLIWTYTVDKVWIFLQNHSMSL